MILLDHHGRDVLFVRQPKAFKAVFVDFESVQRGASPADMLNYYMDPGVSRTEFFHTDALRPFAFRGIISGLGEEEGLEFFERALAERPDLPKLKSCFNQIQDCLSRKDGGKVLLGRRDIGGLCFETWVRRACNAAGMYSYFDVEVYRQGEELGSVSYTVTPFEGFVSEIEVEPAFRGQGYGKRLMRHALDELARQGVTRSQVHVINVLARESYAIIPLVEHFGFRMDPGALSLIRQETIGAVRSEQLDGLECLSLSVSKGHDQEGVRSRIRVVLVDRRGRPQSTAGLALPLADLRHMLIFIRWRLNAGTAKLGQVDYVFSKRDSRDGGVGALVAIRGGFRRIALFTGEIALPALLASAPVTVIELARTAARHDGGKKADDLAERLEKETKRFAQERGIELSDMARNDFVKNLRSIERAVNDIVEVKAALDRECGVLISDTYAYRIVKERRSMRSFEKMTPAEKMKECVHSKDYVTDIRRFSAVAGLDLRCCERIAAYIQDAGYPLEVGRLREGYAAVARIEQALRRPDWRFSGLAEQSGLGKSSLSYWLYKVPHFWEQIVMRTKALWLWYAGSLQAVSAHMGISRGIVAAWFETVPELAEWRMRQEKLIDQYLFELSSANPDTLHVQEALSETRGIGITRQELSRRIEADERLLRLYSARALEALKSCRTQKAAAAVLGWNENTFGRFLKRHFTAEQIQQATGAAEKERRKRSVVRNRRLAQRKRIADKAGEKIDLLAGFSRQIADCDRPVAVADAENLFGSTNFSLFKSLARGQDYHALGKGLKTSFSQSTYAQMQGLLSQQPEAGVAVRTAYETIVPSLFLRLKESMEVLGAQEGPLNRSDAVALIGTLHFYLIANLVKGGSYEDLSNTLRSSINAGMYDWLRQLLDRRLRDRELFEETMAEVWPDEVRTLLKKTRILIDAPEKKLNRSQSLKRVHFYTYIIPALVKDSAYADLPRSVTMKVEEPTYDAMKRYLQRHPSQRALAAEAAAKIVSGKGVATIMAKAQRLADLQAQVSVRKAVELVGLFHWYVMVSLARGDNYGDSGVPGVVRRGMNEQSYGKLQKHFRDNVQDRAVLDKAVSMVVKASKRSTSRAAKLITRSRGLFKQMKEKYGQSYEAISAEAFVNHRIPECPRRERGVIISLVRALQRGEEVDVTRAQGLLEPAAVSVRPVLTESRDPVPAQKPRGKKQRTPARPRKANQPPAVRKKKAAANRGKKEAALPKTGVFGLAAKCYREAEQEKDTSAARKLYDKAVKLLSQVENADPRYEHVQREIATIAARARQRRKEAVRGWIDARRQNWSLPGSSEQPDLLQLWSGVARSSRSSEAGRQRYQDVVSYLNTQAPRELWQLLFIDFVERFFNDNGRIPVLTDFYNSRESALFDKSQGDLRENYRAAGYEDPALPWFIDDFGLVFQRSLEQVQIKVLPQGQQWYQWEGAEVFIRDFLRDNRHIPAGDPRQIASLQYSLDAFIELASGMFGFDVEALTPYVQDHCRSLRERVASVGWDRSHGRKFLKSFFQRLTVLQYDERHMQQHAASVEDARVLKETVIDACRKTIERR